MSSSHTIHGDHHHFGWDNSNPPALTVAPGDSVEFEVVDASGGQLDADSNVSDVARLDFEKVNPVTGPVRVDGAEPGDALRVKIDAFTPSGWGWTAVIPGFGLLADQFPELEQAPGILDAVLANMVPTLSAQILEQWGLEDFSTGALHQENWYYDHDGQADYTDILIVAHLHGLIKAKRFADLPRIDETPAFNQLSALGLSASKSVAILEEAQQELAELKALLT